MYPEIHFFYHHHISQQMANKNRFAVFCPLFWHAQNHTVGYISHNYPNIHQWSPIKSHWIPLSPNKSHMAAPFSGFLSSPSPFQEWLVRLRQLRASNPLHQRLLVTLADGHETMMQCKFWVSKICMIRFSQWNFCGRLSGFNLLTSGQLSKSLGT